MSGLDKITIGICVAVGEQSFALSEVLRFGRGAEIPLAGADRTSVIIFANGLRVARGRLLPVQTGRMQVEITELIRADSDDFAVAA